ncbi:sugar phosphate isomerase/epimerase family protein [Paenibacillus ferrarius]|uniref:sugar phosphate isomerase/epimerase family protein n=1 Tax=Paenibacillus ferrarius TaxID=1469647 RepID=UPI003D2D3034
MRNYVFSTLPCDGWETEQLIQACQRYGLSGIEWRDRGSLAWIDPSAKQIWRQMTQSFEEGGVSIVGIGSSICVKGDDRDRQHLASFRSIAEAAGIAGARGVRIFLGNFTRRFDDPREPLDQGAIVKWLQDACNLAEAQGTSVWIETHNEYATGRNLRGLLEEVGRPNCGIIYDIIHPLEDGEAPEETIELIGDRIMHVHIKDGTPWPDPIEHDWRYTRLGDGSVPLRRICSLLDQRGYQGSYSLEWESKWRSELRGEGMAFEEVLGAYIPFMEQMFDSDLRKKEGQQ